MKNDSLNFFEKITYKLIKSDQKIVKTSFYQKVFTYFNGNNNFFHLATKLQDCDVLNCAIRANQDINAFNSSGLLPIHVLLFGLLTVDEKNNNMPQLYCDDSFYELFFKQKPAVNLFWRRSSLDIKSSFKSIFGYPIEILIMQFQEYIYDFSIEAAELSGNTYLKFFSDLYQFDEKDIVEKKKYLAHHYPDDNTPYFRFTSIALYHISFASGKKNWIISLPLLSSEHTQLDKIDDSGHTLLHFVFGKIHNNIKSMTTLDIENIILAIMKNPNFTLECLNVVNGFGTSPISLLRGESLYLTEYFKKMYLHRELGKHLDNLESKTLEISEDISPEDNNFSFEEEHFKL